MVVERRPEPLLRVPDPDDRDDDVPAPRQLLDVGPVHVDAVVVPVVPRLAPAEPFPQPLVHKRPAAFADVDELDPGRAG